MLKLKNVSKFYYNKGLITSGFSKVNLEFKMGEFVAITGASGSGKSTLLNVLSGLDSYEEGEMYINGSETSHYTEKDLEEYRKKYVSNIFQNFNLVNSYTVYQNVELVLLLNGCNKKEVHNKVIDLLKKVDMYKFKNTKVSKLSGGQKQRVAIARALAKETPIIIADEPTASLDSASASKIIELLSSLSKEKLVIIVTHNFEQVEKYVTRKIVMSDGKVYEDTVITKVNNNSDYQLKNLKPILFISKIRLGIRNAFNIKIKFLLILAVFLFLVFAVSSEYSSNRNDEYLDSIAGQNFYFSSDPKRIVINKKDKEEFTDLDYQNIIDIPGVNSIIKYDLTLDSSFNFTDKNGDYYFYSNLKDMSNIKKENLSYGRMPIADNEVILSGNKDFNYYLSDEIDKILNMEILLQEDYYGYSDNKDITTFKIVGIIIEDSSDAYDLAPNFIDFTFYGNDNFLKYFNTKKIEELSSKKEVINNKQYNILIKPNKLISKGEVYIDESLSYACKNSNCKDDILTLNIENIYHSKSLDLKITNLYNSNNVKKLLNIDNYEVASYYIHISYEDYFSLFQDKNYQISIIVDDDINLYKVNQKLNDLNLNTLVIKDTFSSNGFKEIAGLFKDFFMIALLVALFFITYFIIKLILKSRNTYYATLRILGSSKAVLKQLLTIELLTVSTLAYLIFLGIIYLTKSGVINLNLTTMIKYLGLKEYLVIYLIVTLMSYLISIRYSKKLFKNSTMTTIREEV